MPVIGVAKSGWRTRTAARARPQQPAGAQHLDEAAFAKLLELLRYVDGDYADPKTFASLRREAGQCAAAPCTTWLFRRRLFGDRRSAPRASAGCAQNARVVVEKPFGRSLASAQELNTTLHAIFPEDAIFRIDHFLGKSAVQNIFYFRFANIVPRADLESQLCRQRADHHGGDFGVQGRGKFYDETGAIRDVVQNHLLQVVAYVAMEPPVLSYPEAIRDETVKVFRSIEPLDPVRPCARPIQRLSGRGGRPGRTRTSRPTRRCACTSIPGAGPGVPFFVRTGKCLPVTTTEVLVTLKRPPISNLHPGHGNRIRFRLTPPITLGIDARVKAAGEEMESKDQELTALYDPGAAELGDYERLLTDAMQGEATLFARQDAVEVAWSIVEPILGDRHTPPRVCARARGDRRRRHADGAHRRLAQARRELVLARALLPRIHV